METLKDKIIWITGASRGIGAAIAEKLAETDAKLVLSARSQESFKDILQGLGMKANTFLFPCDLIDSKEIDSVYKKISLAVGKPDVLINNAGIGVFKEFSDLTPDDFDSMMDVNARGTFMILKKVLPAMLEKKEGIIINILSGAVKKAFKGSSVYSASKAAQWLMSRCLREEVRDKGIKVVDVFPGAVETEIWKEELREKYGDKMMQPEDVAKVVYDAVFQSLRKSTMVEEIHLKPQTGDL